MLIAKHMPKGPKGQKRPADVIGNAVHVMRIATGEIEETLTEDGKNAAAVALGQVIVVIYVFCAHKFWSFKSSLSG